VKLIEGKAPPGASEALRLGLRRSLPSLERRSPEFSMRRDEGGAAVMTSDVPHYVYALGINDLDEDFLEKARQVAVRYLLAPGNSNDVRASAEIATEAGGTVRGFSNLTIGPKAAAMRRALDVAADLPDSDDPAEIRALEIPALYFAALWLYRGFMNDFIPLDDLPPSLKAMSLYDSLELLAGLRQHVEVRREKTHADDREFPV
jgi:hypothetical protein